MLKGQVFSRQLFENQIFALFINTFLNGNNGVSNNFLNNMEVTYSGNNLTVNSGAVCIQGRFLKEDSSTTISAGTDTSYCKLVVEINLDNQNTESDFRQAYYKIIKGANSYPALTQNDIVKNNAGIYQYELARFQNSSSGITNFQDMRTFLDFESIYDIIQEHIRAIDAGSTHVAKSGDTMTGNLNMESNKVKFSNDGGVEWKENGYGDKFRMIPNFTGSGDSNKLLVQGIVGGAGEDGENWVTLAEISAQNGNVNIIGNISSGGLPIGKTAKITGSMTIEANSNKSVTINYPSGFTKDNCYVVACGIQATENRGYNFIGIYKDSLSLLMNAYHRYVNTTDSGINLIVENPNTSSSRTVTYKILLMKIN